MEKLMHGNPTPVPTTDWYRDATPEARREYDEFGPWVLAIRSETDMPPRFRPWFSAHEGAPFLVKVPRDVERRHLRPGEDLYRAVIAVHEDHLCCLSLEEGVVTEQNIPLSEIEALHHSEVLLWGQLRLWLLGGGEWSLSYNTVSSPVMIPLVDFLRRTMAPARPLAQLPPVLVEDYFFSALAGEHLRRDAANQLVFCEAPAALPGAPSRRPRYTGGLLVLDNGSELTFLTQGTGGRRTRRAELGRHALHLPRRSLVEAEVRDRVEKDVYLGRNLELKTRSGRTINFALIGEGKALTDYLAATKP